MSSGAAGIWAMKTGDFIATEFPGSSDGLLAALAFIGSTGGLVQVCSGTFTIAEMALASNLTLQGAGIGATIFKLQNSGNSNVLNGSGKTNITLRDFTIDGNKANQTVAGAGIRVTTCTNVRIERVHSHDCKLDGFYISGCTDVAVASCISADNTRNGYSLGDANGVSIRVRFRDCTSSGHSASNAIGFSIEPGQFCSVSGCVSVGDYNAITCAGGASDASSFNEIVGNTLVDFTTAAFINLPGTGGSAQNIFANNTLRPGAAATAGIVITGATDITVKGNRIAAFGVSTGSTGIFADTSLTRFLIEGNHIHQCGNYGIIITGATRGVIQGNVIRNCSTNSSGVRDGIRLVDSTDVAVTGNNVFDDQGSPTTNYALQTTGSSDRITVVGNNFRGVSQAAMILMVGANNQVGKNQGPPIPTVASAATVTLPAHSDIVIISGTTTITSVTASWVGRVVTLMFSGILTFTDGSNLKLLANFVTTADDTITMYCDGTNWFEMSRSAN